MADDHRRSSIKQSIYDARASVSVPAYQLTLPKRSSVLFTGGQLFLCLIGFLLSFGICIWLTIFSQDAQWRRFLFATGAALCALLFALLGILTKKKTKQQPIQEVLPNLAHRRSTAIRIARKSMCSTNQQEIEQQP